MTSSCKRFVDFVSYGEPPKKLQKSTESCQFVINDFKNVKKERGQFIESIANIHGFNWNIKVYPRGSRNSSTETEHLSVYLCLSRSHRATVIANYSIHCNEWSKKKKKNKVTFGCKGYKNFLKREDVLSNHLQADGSLVLEIDVTIADEDNIKRVWYPMELKRQDTLVELYDDAMSESADVEFLVGERVCLAHKNILYLRCQKLYEIAEDYDSNAPIPIPTVRNEIFKAFLDYVYTVKEPEIESEDIAIELLDIANRFDCVHLKLYVEFEMVNKFLSIENFLSFLMLADSHSCALLMESAIDFFVSNTDMKNAEAWSRIRESDMLLEEVIDRLSCTNQPLEEDRGNDSSRIDRLDVAGLRQELEEASLELDGSRKILINRLQMHHQKQDKKNRRCSL